MSESAVSNSTNNNVTALFAPLLSEVLSDDLIQQFATTGTTARIEDDAFQDLDLASLDNLMRGTGEDGQRQHRMGCGVRKRYIRAVLQIFLLTD
jgi:hypothetical protein